MRILYSKLDILRVGYNIHVSRSSKLRKLPKTLSKLHKALNYVVTNHGENYKFRKLKEMIVKNIVFFVCFHNLKILNKIKTVFVDRTLKIISSVFFFTIYDGNTSIFFFTFFPTTQL